MAADEKWYFTKAQLANTPSRRCGLDADKELSYRQQAANFIQDMGQRLKVTQLCINTAIVYMHRFYIFHSFTQFHRNSMASASLFLAAKVEEQPRKLEHVITVAHWCLFREEPKLDTKSEQYLEQAQELVFNENVLLQTLGFDVAIDHPHTHVVRCCHLVRANKELAQTSYFMASNSLHLTTMCLQYKPTVVACFCIHLACKWSNWEIPQSSEGKDWFTYVDPAVSLESLEQLTSEFLLIFDKCPSRLKKMSGKKDDSYGLLGHNLTGPQMEQEPRRVRPTLPSGRPGIPGQSQDGATGSSSMMPQARQIVPDESKRVDYREYKEKKAREAAAAAVAAGGASKDGKPPPPHPQQNRQPPPHHHLAKREAAKREMMARESAKREAMKQEASRSREGSTQRPVEVPNQHHPSQESRDLKRPRDVPDSAAGSSQQLSDSSSASILQQKRPESHHPPVESRRSREPSDVPPSSSHHHHHPDQSRSQRPRELLDPSPSNHHNHPSMHSSNQMKRSREDLGSLNQSVSQPKRPREGTDPMVNILDSAKRPREPPDSNNPFNSITKSEPNVQSSSSTSQHGDKHHLDMKHSGVVTKYTQDPKSQQLPSLSAFGDLRQSKPVPSANMSSSQRHFNHNRHSRPQEGNSKNYDQQERSKRDSPGLSKIQQDVHSLRPSHVGKSPIPPLSRSKSPSEPPKLSDSRSRSPFMAASNSQEPEKKPDKRMAVIMSRAPGHLFSPPNDDLEDLSLPSLDISLPELIPTKFDNKLQRPSPSIKPKLRISPEKNRESVLAPPMFILPSSPTSPATPGKSGLPTTPTTSDRRKRTRTQSSSSSEPELVPVVRKLEDVPGFHTLLKDGAIKLPGRVPDMIQPIREHNLPSTPGKETPSPSNIKQDQHANDIKSLMLQPILSESEDRSFSGFSSLLDMSHQSSTMAAAKMEVVEPVPIPSLFDPPVLSPEPVRLMEPQRVEEVSVGGEHHRKKKKEKHNKKDKDRNREEKKHKHKKNKDRDKAREEKNVEQQATGSSAPIRLTIPKDKINLSEEAKKSPSLSQDSTSGLKIKIPKERLKVEPSPMPSSSSTASSVSLGGLKIKIGKELMSERRLESSPSDHVSRKQRSNDTNAAASAATAASRQPQSNTARRNYNKQNGHPDRKVRGAYARGRGRAPPMHPPPLHYPPQQYYPYPPPPPPPPMYMYPPDTQHMYGYYPPQPAMYQPQFQPLLPMIGDFQTPPPPPLPEGPPPTAPPPPPPPE